jgi:hypothetical protein
MKSLIMMFVESSIAPVELHHWLLFTTKQEETGDVGTFKAIALEIFTTFSSPPDIYIPARKPEMYDLELNQDRLTVYFSGISQEVALLRFYC